MPRPPPRKQLVDDARLIEYAFGGLSASERDEVDAAVAADPALCAALRQLLDTVARMDAGAVPTGAALRERVVGALRAPASAGEYSRYDGFAGRLARLFDLPLASAEALLPQLADPSQAPWGPLPEPRCRWLRVEAGAALGDAVAMFVYLPGGATLPSHQHAGEERLMVLDGYAQESTGRRVRPGDLVVSAPGSSHGFEIEPGSDCLFAVVLDRSRC